MTPGGVSLGSSLSTASGELNFPEFAASMTSSLKLLTSPPKGKTKATSQGLATASNTKPSWPSFGGVDCWQPPSSAGGSGEASLHGDRKVSCCCTTLSDKRRELTSNVKLMVGQLTEKTPGPVSLYIEEELRERT